MSEMEIVDWNVVFPFDSEIIEWFLEPVWYSVLIFKHVCNVKISIFTI